LSLVTNIGYDINWPIDTGSSPGIRFYNGLIKFHACHTF
jgi:hypothetical protein